MICSCKAFRRPAKLYKLGAESDSDAPPDERAPAFFVNEDGSKVPRPRTRKERMGSSLI